MEAKSDEAIKLQHNCPRCGASELQCRCEAVLEKNGDSAADADLLAQQEGAGSETFDDTKYIGGRYRVISILGKGGMGTVYKVKHEALNKVYAAKVLNPGVSSDLKVLARFDQEAKAGSQLAHENLMAVYDYGATDSGAPYMVMEYFEGVSLADEISKLGHIEEKRAIAIFIQVCDGLVHAHSHGVIHRDLKPSNIMLIKDGKGKELAKIVDFGIVKRQAVDLHVTQTGEVLGTPLYMSPEQCMGHKVDSRSDLYSLGCVMYETLSGKSPFEAANAVQTIFRHVNDDALPLRKACSGFEISQAMEQIVARCLSKEPIGRPISADELGGFLQRAAKGQAPGLTARMSRKHRSRISNTLKVTTIAALCWIALSCLVIQLVAPTVIADYLLPKAQWRIDAGQAQSAAYKGDWPKAIELAETAYDEARADHADSTSQLRLMLFKADIYAHAEQFSQASTAYSKLAQVQAVEGNKNIPSASKLFYQAVVNASAAKKDNLSHLCKRWIDAKKVEVGADSPELEDCYYGAGKYCFDIGNYAQCRMYLVNALKLNATAPRLSSSQNFYSTVMLGLCALKLNDLGGAEAYAKLVASLPSSDLNARELEFLKKFQRELKTVQTGNPNASGKKTNSSGTNLTPPGGKSNSPGTGDATRSKASKGESN